MAQPTHDSDYHMPVMVDETVAWLSCAADGWIIDGTFGGGGHSHALLAAYPRARVIGLDRDSDAIAEAFADDRLDVVRSNYRDIDEVLANPAFPDSVEGILLDLGVSSHQLDVADRGFSYHHDGPLDMRMGRDAAISAADVVNTWSEVDLARIISRYGEEKFARRIASAIVDARPLRTTSDLAACIAGAVPAAARRKRHPARKTFQAIRITVNEELDGLEEVLVKAPKLVAPGGRFVVMAYHSLEDRLVKRAFVDLATGCICPPELPACACGRTAEFTLCTRKAVKPTEAEIAANPRARSAVLRVLERTRP